MPVVNLIETPAARLPESAHTEALRCEMARGSERVALELLIPRHTAERLEELAALLCEDDPTRTVDALATEALDAFLRANGA